MINPFKIRLEIQTLQTRRGVISNPNVEIQKKLTDSLEIYKVDQQNSMLVQRLGEANHS